MLVLLGVFEVDEAGAVVVRSKVGRNKKAWRDDVLHTGSIGIGAVVYIVIVAFDRTPTHVVVETSLRPKGEIGKGGIGETLLNEMIPIPQRGLFRCRFFFYLFGLLVYNFC